MRRFFTLSLPKDTAVTILSCHTDDVVAFAVASSAMGAEIVALGASKELDGRMWRREVVRAGVLVLLCEVCAPVVTFSAQKVPVPSL